MVRREIRIGLVTLIAPLHIHDALSVFRSETTPCHFHALDYFSFLRITLRIHSKEICARNNQNILAR